MIVSKLCCLVNVIVSGKLVMCIIGFVGVLINKVFVLG